MALRLIFGWIVIAGAAATAAAQEEKVSISSRIAGIVEKIHVKVGDAVQKGQILIEIDSALQRVEVEKANAQLAAAEARVARANAEYERGQRLVQVKAISREEFDNITAQRAEAQASLQLAKAVCERERILLDSTKLQAPVDGKVTRVAVTRGDSVKANETLLAVVVPAGAAQPKVSAKLNNLLKERRDILAKLADLAMSDFDAGRGSNLGIFNAQRALLEADLELAETHAERLKLLRKGVKITEPLLALVQARVKAGQAPPTELLQMQTMVLDARIRLLREEEKTGAERK